MIFWSVFHQLPTVIISEVRMKLLTFQTVAVSIFKNSYRKVSVNDYICPSAVSLRCIHKTGSYWSRFDLGKKESSYLTRTWQEKVFSLTSTAKAEHGLVVGVRKIKTHRRLILRPFQFLVDVHISLSLNCAAVRIAAVLEQSSRWVEGDCGISRKHFADAAFSVHLSAVRWSSSKTLMNL